MDDKKQLATSGEDCHASPQKLVLQRNLVVNIEHACYMCQQFPKKQLIFLQSSLRIPV